MDLAKQRRLNQLSEELTKAKADINRLERQKMAGSIIPMELMRLNALYEDKKTILREMQELKRQL